jgi:hypothetical protein
MWAVLRAFAKWLFIQIAEDCPGEGVKVAQPSLEDAKDGTVYVFRSTPCSSSKSFAYSSSSFKRS